MTPVYFVILGAMRTGSNLLEELLNTVPDVEVHGELFNPHFVGGPKRDGFLGFDVETRDRDPSAVLAALSKQEGLNGFRLFHDHDPRVIEAVLADPKVAKIVLTRRPIDSYASLKVARKTGQWWMGNMATAKSAKITFHPPEYDSFVEDLVSFHGHVSRNLQVSGQTAFQIDYADLRDRDVLAGLCKFLGVSGAPDPDAVKAKVQNPAPLSDLFTNPDLAAAHVGDSVDLFRPRALEADRGPGVRGYVMTDDGVLYMPIPGASADPIAAALGGNTDQNRRVIRAWMERNKDHTAVTVLRHPLERAHDAFCHAILSEDGPMPDVRDALARHHGVDVDCGEDLERHQFAFLTFLGFLTGNLSGQSALPVQRVWASQHKFVEAMAGFRPPDHLIRAGETENVGGVAAIWPDTRPFTLSEVATAEHRDAAFKAYRRDYLTFGFAP